MPKKRGQVVFPGGIEEGQGREEMERLKGLDGKAPSQEALQEGALPLLPRLLNSRASGLFGLVAVLTEGRVVSCQLAESPARAPQPKPGFESVKSHPGEWP